jgi:hypothetical protein
MIDCVLAYFFLGTTGALLLRKQVIFEYHVRSCRFAGRRAAVTKSPWPVGWSHIADEKD